jgi:signal transduction histidine kinase
MQAFSVEMTFERRQSLRILVFTRWMLIATALFVIDYRPSTDTWQLILLNGLVLLAGGLNATLQARISSPRALPLALPLAVSFYDVVAVTASIGALDGFENHSYLLYFPALLGFSMAFPGRLSAVYTTMTAVGYTAVVVTTPAGPGFHWSYAGDQHMLVLRLATMAATAAAANLIHRVEHERLRRAITAEGERRDQVVELERRAAEAAAEADRERARLLNEVHDGLSQGVYMLSLGLETTAAELAAGTAGPQTALRVNTLVGVAKQALLETRNLLMDLDKAMAGETSLSSLLRHQTEEFTAVTGISVRLDVAGEEVPLPPPVVGQVHRVVQESLSNVFRHAHATGVEVRLDYERGFLKLDVADNGCGFDATAVRERGHGIKSMKERGGACGGTLTVDSSVGRGTRLRLSIPCSEGGHGSYPDPAG